MDKWYEEPVGSEIIRKKYLHEGEKTFENMILRIAACFSEGIRDEIKSALQSADFFPAGRSLFALGCKGKFSATTSNCYVLPSPEDNLPSIFEAAKAMAIIFSKGGGCGINLSQLRPRGAKVQNAAKISSGAVSFAHFYNAVGSIINQNGRRGALLIGLNSDHPDVEEFLKVKQNNEMIQSANISILFDDSFMKAMEAGQKYQLRFDVKATGERIRRQIDAAEFFCRFCNANKDYAEPGAIFIDRVRSWNLLSADPDYLIEISNPCGEFFGNAFNSCNLGSINLYNLVDHKFTDDAVIPIEKLQQKVSMAVEALDEILDYGYDLQPLEENRQKVKDYRAIGLGVFGFGDALVALGLRYGSKETITWCEKTFKEIFLQALRTSNRLAKDKGPFDKCQPELLLQAPILQFVEKEDPGLWASIRQYGLRNASLLAVAPTGTISTMCGFSGGIEPLFQIAYKRTTHSLVKEGKYFDVFAKSVKDLMAFHSINPATSSAELQNRFPFIVTAHDIDPVERVKVQASIQGHVDNAISSTVNMHEGASTEEIMSVYKAAWQAGCKGVTVFVKGCKRTAIMERSPNY